MSVPVRNYIVADVRVQCYRLGAAMYGPGTRYACYNRDTMHPITTVIKTGSRWITSVFPSDPRRTIKGALERYVDMQRHAR